MNMIFWKLEEQLKPDCDLLLQVHDEAVVECDLEDVEYVADLMRTVSRIPLEIIEGKPLYIPIEIKAGWNWMETVPVEEWLTNWKQESAKI